MTAVAVRSELDNYRANLDQLVHAIRAVNNLTDLTEVRARVEAAKAWAKVHGEVKSLRLDLLRVEVGALVRIAELGFAHTLSPSDAKAARWLADMSESERAGLLADSGTATTAAGMCRTVWQREEWKADRARYRSEGNEFAEEPEPLVYDEARIKERRQQRHAYVTGVAAALANAVESYTDAGEPFSIDGMAEEIVADTQIDPRYTEDAEFMKGIREVCRAALMSSPPLTFDGTVVPQFITCKTPLDAWVRIPTPNATVGHLDEMVELRKLQLAHNAAALERLTQFADRVKSYPDVTASTRIGAVLAASIADDEDERVAS